MKKGSVVIYVLALMLVTAGYWAYISNETQTLETVSVGNENENENTTSDEHLGDATLVSNNEVVDDKSNENNAKSDNEKTAKSENADLQDNQENKQETKETSATNKDDYFQESKLSRDTMYSQTLETYQGILNNSNVSEEQKAIVTQQITDLNKEKNAIMICENLMSTKGFNKCVIFVNVDSISVIVGAEELKADEIAQIQNIISREMSAKVENIHIMTKK